MTRKPTEERKLAMRMMLREMRRGDVWSNGTRVLRGQDLARARRDLVHRLAGNGEGLSPGQLRTGNSLALLRLYRRRPGLHGLPADLAGLLRVKCGELASHARRDVPGSAAHAGVFRRIARRIGAIRPGEFAPEQEFGFRRERLAKAPGLRVAAEDVIVERELSCGGFEPHRLVKGDCLIRLEDRANRWATQDGEVVTIFRLDPVDFAPARAGKAPKLQLARGEEPDAGPSP